MAVTDYYKDWYAKNKQKLSEKRKKKYQEDQGYRERAIASSKKQRSNKPQKPTGFDLTFDQAADLLGVSSWSLREWRKKEYFPSPVVYGGRMWFTAAQVELLRKLYEFFKENGRVGASIVGKVAAITQEIASCWNVVSE